ncbi:protein TPX2-like isoform X2 [Lotus japonicus]|uniref:protein TPX2-like isoform X2 n=1 Tax=Lotus japonicus TaxID=34305 RepID=UPI00258B45F8|nr:protein TPX2-like isoform X2 [Lotus japonicus]
MMMEQDEESEIMHVFVAHEIDLEYEFDAARFFDFTRPETPQEAHQAELWFHNAASYPPSPFVTRLLVREDLVLDDVDDSPKSNHLEECTSNVDDDKPCVPLEMECSDNNNEALGGKISGLLAGILLSDGMRPLQVPKGLTFDSKAISESLNSKAKSAVPKRSTLMKPTASQLAKQNRCVKNNGSRFQKLLNQNESHLSISSVLESQAPKRQKLEGGLLRKVTDVKPETNFVHKTSKKLTIPREPDLKTAQRARRIRLKDEEAEHMTVAASRFKARPLNRRILDGPSLPLPKRSTPRLPEFQEFHLKTSERATQHTSAPSSSLHCNDYDKGWDKHTAVSAVEPRIKDLKRPTAMGAPKCDGLGFTHIFKAQPLNKKILSSKGDVGVVRSIKQDITVPMEFDLNTEKVAQHNPPIELFSKLSLTSEAQLNDGAHFKLPQHSGMCRKEKAFIFRAKQIHPGNGGCISLMSARRSLGIR